VGDFLPPVVVELAASIGEYSADFARAGEQAAALGTEMGAAGQQITASTTEAAAGIDRLAAATTEEAAKVTASNDQILASMRAVGVQADRTAEQYYLAQTKMAATTQKLAYDMEVAEAKAIASTEALGATMTKVAAETDAGFGAKLAAARKPLMLVGAAAAVVGVATVKMAGDFESSTNRLVTSAGEVHQNLEMVRQGILSMAGEVGYSAEELSKAMYTIESGGQHGAAGLQVLRAAAEGAKAENAELKTVADAVTSVLVDYHLKAEDAAAVTSKLVAATSAGKTTFEELSGSMASVLPVASAAHISLDDILGDLASMTVHGESAQQSAQNLTDVIRHMQNPTQMQTKELALMGISAQNLADDLSSKGLSGTLQEISNRIRESMGPGATKVILDLGTALKTLPKDVQALGQKLIDGSISQAAYNKEAKAMDPIAAHQAAAFATLAASTHVIGNEQLTGGQVMQSYGAALAKATGDATGLNVALMLTGENADTTNNAVRTVAGAATEAGNHVRGWADIQGTFNQKVSEAKDGLGALAIAVGEKLLPVVSWLADKIAITTKFLADHKVAAEALAIVIGGAVTIAFAAAAAAAWSFTAAILADPLTWIVLAVVAAVALLVFGLVELFTHLSQIGDFFATIWNAAWKWTSDRITDIVGFVKGLPGKLWDALSGLGSKLGQLAKDAWDWFTRGIKSAWNATLAWFRNLPHEIGYAMGFLAGTLAKLAIDGWNNFTRGIKIAFQATVKFFRELPGNIADFFASVGTWLANTGRDLLVGLWNGIKNGWTNTVQFFHDLPGNILNWLAAAGEWLINTGRDLLRGLWNGIKNGWTATVQFFHDLPGNVKGWLSDAGEWLWNAGADLVRGLWNGITSLAGWLWDQVTSWARGIVQGMKDAMGIGSPSRLTHEVGGFLVEGLANGIHANTPLAVQAVHAMTRKVMDAHQSAGLSLPLALEGSMSASAMGGGRPGGGRDGFGSLTFVMNPRDVAKLLQQGVLRYNLQNSSNGLAVSA
jgi:TP901 family phage tail tape measure protein